MKHLKIIMTVDPEIPVPPVYYGGVERIVYMLICGLVERGHEIHLFANPESKTPAKLIAFQGKRSNSLIDTMRNALQIKNYVKGMGKVDIIHSFGRLAYLLPLMHWPIPKIQSYGRHITPRSIFLGALLGGKTLTFVSCSKFCANAVDSIGGRWVVIPNGVPTEKYQFNPHVPLDAPLIFLGRIEQIKGTHTAIEVAKRTGRCLIIAGNHDTYGLNYDYFKEKVLPHCDGKTIQYVGQVDDIQKNELLGKSTALLFPIGWDEPFGLVMAEALACGTPVIAFDRGAVSEVIQNGINGFVCDTAEEMLDAVKKIESIDRKRCRDIVETKFSNDVIIEEYLKLYEQII